jgi:Ca2+-binding RTX toxin-like protein
LTPERLVKQPNGSYTLDAAWNLATYDYFGTPKTPTGQFITVDGAENVYVADGSFGGNFTHRVVKYTSAGAFVTQFGDQSSSGSADTFYGLHGLVVTPDGSKIYTADGNNSRVVRWDRQANGTYSRNAFQLGTTQVVGCATTGAGAPNWQNQLASPYDVALDSAGDLYVLNTTCHEVLRFRADGTFVTANRIGVDDAGVTNRPHGFAVARDGNRIFVSQSDKRLVLDGIVPPTTCRSTATTQVGTPNADPALTGTANADVIAGLAGDDAISGLGAADKLCGDAGFDTLTGGRGNDELDGGAEGGVASYSDASLAIDADLSAGPSSTVAVAGGETDTLYSIQNIIGSGAGDQVDGSTNFEFIDGLAGIDTLNGAGGNDRLEGGTEGDFLDGGAGADRLFGEAGDDELTATDGTVETVIDCGTGADTLFADAAETGIAIDCETINPDDVDPPETTIIDGPPAVVKTRKRRKTVAFDLASDEAGSTFKCSIDGLVLGDCDPRTLVSVRAARPARPHTFEAWAVDSEGNEDGSPDIWSFKAKRLR